MRYSSVLRCLGQTIETLELKAVEIKSHGVNFIVQAWHRGTSMAMEVEKHYSPEEQTRPSRAPKAKTVRRTSESLELIASAAMGGQLCRSRRREASPRLVAGSVRQNSIDHDPVGSGSS